MPEIAASLVARGRGDAGYDREEAKERVQRRDAVWRETRRGARVGLCEDDRHKGQPARDFEGDAPRRFAIEDAVDLLRPKAALAQI